ncbi:MAG: hypothetical protein AABZ74_18365 [Cyanobacteriota bacterium]
MAKISIVITESQHKEIQKISDKYYLNTSSIIRLIIDIFLKNENMILEIGKGD